MRFLQKLYFAEYHNFPCGRLISKQDGGSVILTEPAYYPTNGSIAVHIAETLDILESLGLIKVFFDTWLSRDIYLQKYSEIEGFLKSFNPSYLANNIELEKGYIKLSDFGLSLCSCIFE
ncbi:Abi-alpha family protein [Lactobacillus equicursoris]|uniref:Abi-alpha family protein n=1 Tax=Lactobacillus equicursoris TaxID=420645 RepID=UPI0012DD7386